MNIFWEIGERGASGIEKNSQIALNYIPALDM